MRIKKINIPTTPERNDGLGDIKMERLDKIVLLAGKNGSGKTRILNKIFNILESKPNKESIEKYENIILESQSNIVSCEESMKELEYQVLNQKSFGLSDSVIARNNMQINSYKVSISNTQQRIESIEKLLSWDLINTSEIANAYSYVPFVPKKLDLIDCNTLRKAQMVNAAKAINSVGTAELPRGTFARIQMIQDRWFNATHQFSTLSDVEKNEVIKDYEKLMGIIQIFLGTAIGRSVDGEPELFNLSMTKAQLSDGQKILLQLCLAIHSQETALKDLILILDEPENHLHPSVIIETIEKLMECVPNGQIWIATHSIPLLAHFDPSLIWFVENGKIQHAGKIPEKVLSSLLGNESEVGRLQDFISLPAQYATSRFAFECLFEPNVVITGPNDPQSLQIRSKLLELSSGNKLRILDYGAGKGRVLSNIVDLDESNVEKLIESIDYIAYDKYPDDKDPCENALKKAYGKSDKLYFNNWDNLISTYDKKSFDVVIMCNVLHEIDPKEWLALFGNEGTISSLLKDKGVLLLVEDNQMPVGEKAYQKGFLVLDTPQLKELFKISERDTEFIAADQKGDGRLKAHLIPKECLNRIDADSRIKAIRAVKTTAKQKILDIRAKEKSYNNGKLHGFWTQELANAELNLMELTTP